VAKKTKLIDVVTGEKVEGDFDPTRAIKGTITPPADVADVAGRSSEATFIFECAWCGAINYSERRDSTVYVCCACRRPMTMALA
jgi:predicted SprT family Zn-dependent metalloprotease